RCEHQLADAFPIVAIDALHVVGKRRRMHRNLRMTISTFDADGPIAERSALGSAGDDSDVLDHGQNDNAAVLRKAFAIVSKLFVTCFAVLPDGDGGATLSMMHAVSTRIRSQWGAGASPACGEFMSIAAAIRITSPNEERVIERAAKFAQQQNTTLYVISVVRELPHGAQTDEEREIVQHNLDPIA